MSSVNKAIILGRLGQDPEIRYTASGTQVANFTVATSETWKDKAGEKQEKTEWHRIVIFGRLAEVAGEYLRKGSLAYFEGRIETQKWQDQQGNDRHTTQIVVSNMQMLGSKTCGQQRHEQAAPHASNPQPHPQSDFDDQDIPF